MALIFWILAATTVGTITVSTGGKFNLNGIKLYNDKQTCKTVQACVEKRRTQWIKK